MKLNSRKARGIQCCVLNYPPLPLSEKDVATLTPFNKWRGGESSIDFLESLVICKLAPITVVTFTLYENCVKLNFKMFHWKITYSQYFRKLTRLLEAWRLKTQSSLWIMPRNHHKSIILQFSATGPCPFP